LRLFFWYEMRCNEFLRKKMEFQILESEFQFDNILTAEFYKKNPTGISGIRIMLLMGV
jgi:hypothetical protein